MVCDCYRVFKKWVRIRLREGGRGIESLEEEACTFGEMELLHGVCVILKGEPTYMCGLKGDLSLI